MLLPPPKHLRLHSPGSDPPKPQELCGELDRDQRFGCERGQWQEEFWGVRIELICGSIWNETLNRVSFQASVPVSFCSRCRVSHGRIGAGTEAGKPLLTQAGSLLRDTHKSSVTEGSQLNPCPRPSPNPPASHPLGYEGYAGRGRWISHLSQGLPLTAGWEWEGSCPHPGSPASLCVTSLLWYPSDTGGSTCSNLQHSRASLIPQHRQGVV